MISYRYLFSLWLAFLILYPSPASAFGAGNIASISKVEGRNWRHGDIEDMLKTVACLRGHKWTSMMIKRVYFGNWLRDYSQAIDVGTLSRVQAETIRILIWVLAFMSFGYATGEFEVTTERLGVYRPEEHIDNPKDYADNMDARQYDTRLRPPITPAELEVDPNTGMKNYIANEYGGWATSAGYVKFSLARSIHFGRVYCHGAGGSRGKEADLCEALRCLGQGLHCVEDFGAHTNYAELALRELGFMNVFPHVGASTQISIGGKFIFPLVTGTFGGVDFLHSVLGEATDHFTQSEIDEMDIALGNSASQSHKTNGGASAVTSLTNLLSKIPGTAALCQEAVQLQAASDAQAAVNANTHGSRGLDDEPYGSTRAPGQYQGPPVSQPPTGSAGGPPGPGIPGMNPNTDPTAIIPKIYPILEFRDKVVRAISNVVSKIPGLESLVENITERVTIFVMSLLAPFIQPIIRTASQQLKQGSSAVVDSSAKQQYLVWTDPYSTDPTHSMLSKDHFSNVLNPPAGQVASVILQYVTPRVIYAWEHPDVPVDQVLNDVVQVFHHPALRNHGCELHKNMFNVVERWVQSLPDRGHNLNNILSSESVRAGRNHITPGENQGGHGHGHGHGGHGGHGTSSHSKVSGSPFELYNKRREEFDGGSDPVSHQQPYQQQYSQDTPYMPGPPASDPYTYPTSYQQGYEPFHPPVGGHQYDPNGPRPQHEGYGFGHGGSNY